MRNLHDRFFHQAKTEGYLSRAAYKLIEIDDRKRLVRGGDWVLDVGCAPGSWLQVLAQRVAPSGRVVGVDLKEVDGRRFDDSVRIVQGDLLTVTLEELLGSWIRERPADRPPFNAILSDVGPDTTGDPGGDSARSVRLCDTLLDRSATWLRRGGNIAMKVYEGGDYPALLKRTKSLFDDAKGFKPDASRSESVEIYLVAHGWRGRPGDGAKAGGSPSPRRRSSGWQTG